MLPPPTLHGSENGFTGLSVILNWVYSMSKNLSEQWLIRLSVSYDSEEGGSKRRYPQFAKCGNVVEYGNVMLNVISPLLIL